MARPGSDPPATLEEALEALKRAAQDRESSGRGTPEHTAAEDREKHRADDVWTVADGLRKPEREGP
jgi:hypothetical protein